MNGLVSVIVPVYNVKLYLAEALDSVINQSYENLEIIIIDDGSTDGSGVICDEYADRDGRIRVIHQENRGLSGARNAGLDCMTGDYVAFLDPDDVYHEAFIEKLQASLIREGADIAVCKFTEQETVEKLDSERIGVVRPLMKAGVYDHNAALKAATDNVGLSFAAWNKLYRRKLWKDIRFPEGHVYEDIETTFQVVDHAGTVCVLDEVLYIHRKHSGSITRTESLSNYLDMYLAHSNLAILIEEKIPEVLTCSEIHKAEKSALNALIKAFARYSRLNKEDAMMSGKELRRRIIEEGRKPGFRTLGVRIGTAWCLIYACPCFFRVIYEIYHPVRQLVRKVFGK